ncbi:hypothetical protein Dcar01_02634 [Deinococcus carri]|uniref:Uncharacterized protein n=1 Tax=Deinococcus carri TaxID=1211323 RepID=A0ABP9W961_9DEIO
MTREDEKTPAGQGQGTGGALKSPESPSQGAVEQHADEGDGPFGADMQNMLGGTRSTSENHNPEPAADAYGTGTDPHTGGSLTPLDSRSTFAERGTGTDEDSAGADKTH